MAKRLCLSLAFALFILSSPALADKTGPYLAIHGGGVLLDEAKFRDELGTFHLDFDAGWGGALAVGYDFGNTYPWLGQGRLELEAAYRTNDLDEADFAQGKVSAEGEMTAESLMLNTYGEYRDQAPWVPYVGLGLGYAVITLKDASVSGSAFLDEEDEVLAFQFAAGTTYLITPSCGIDLGYRLLGTERPKFDLSDGSGTVRGEYLSHAFTLGLRLTF